ncbi:MAG: hypothetical protein Q7S19_01905 [bacterium]|nr:hypothetical protein [bacterium]
MLRNSRHSLLILLAFLLVTFFIFKDGFNKAVAEVGGTQYLSGYAWSSNIGWINFNSLGATPDYKVTYNDNNLDTDPNDLGGTWGDLSGYAWSSNIGWISFGCGQPDDTPGAGGVQCSDLADFLPCYPDGAGGCDPAGIGARVDDASAPLQLQGFARACSVFEVGCSGALKSDLDLGGWDGWISLSGATYGVTYTDGTKKFGSFAWGGGIDGPDILGRNISPQSPGWISFSGQTTGGDEYGVKLCDTADCGEAITGVTCERPQPIVNTDIKWKVTVNPPNPLYTYQWTITPPNNDPALTPPTDYEIIGNTDVTSEMTVRYYTPGQGDWITDVEVFDGATPVGRCQSSVTEYTVGDEGFTINAEPNAMTAQFIRSVRTVTFPDITIRIDAFGGFNDPFVKIVFVGIIDQGLSPKSGPGQALLVDDQMFWKNDADIPTKDIILDRLTSATPTTPATYQTAKLRLKLTKNQDPSLPEANKQLPSSRDANPLIRYDVIIDRDTGGNFKDIELKINNPSGGVIEK